MVQLSAHILNPSSSFKDENDACGYFSRTMYGKFVDTDPSNPWIEDRKHNESHFRLFTSEYIDLCVTVHLRYRGVH